MLMQGISFRFYLTISIILSIFFSPFALYADRCKDEACFKRKKYREWYIAGGIAVGGLAAFAIARSIWPITHSRGCNCPGSTATNTTTTTTSTSTATGPAQLTFAFSQQITAPSPVTWTGSIITPSQQVFSTGTFSSGITPTNSTIVIGPPSLIGTYTIVFFVNSNSSPSTFTSLGTVVETNSPSGSTASFTTPIAPSLSEPSGYTAGSQVTFQFVYNPNVNP